MKKKKAALEAERKAREKEAADKASQNSEMLLQKLADLEARISNMDAVSGKIEELENDYINNIMVSKYKDLQEPKKNILRNFYENIDTNIDTTFYENIKKTILNKFDENIILSKAKKSKAKKIYDFIIDSKKIN